MRDNDRRFLQVVQEELPLEPRPFAAWAEQLGITEDELVARMQDYKQRKWIRRFGVLLYHRKAGYTYNAMVALDVPSEQADTVGRRVAEFPYVTHCYRRTRHEAWPFNMYAMVHARSEEEYQQRVEEVKAAAGNFPTMVLLSTKEFKKTSLRIGCGGAGNIPDSLVSPEHELRGREAEK